MKKLEKELGEFQSMIYYYNDNIPGLFKVPSIGGSDYGLSNSTFKVKILRVS